MQGQFAFARERGEGLVKKAPDMKNAKLVYLLSASLMPWTLFSQDYEVEGTAQFKVFIMGRTQEQAVVHFRCSVRNCEWLIRTRADNASGFDYQDVSFDGSQIYYVTSMERMVREAKREKGDDKIPDNVATGYIYKGRVFRNAMATEVGPVWLAYASICYFDDAVGDVIDPVVAFDGSGVSFQPPNEVKQRAYWKRLPEFLRLPTEVVYFDDGILRNYSLTPKTVRRRPPPYDRGFTNAVYRVTSFTNVGEFRLPAASALELFAPNEKRSASTDLILKARYEINLLKFSTNVSVVGLQAEIPGKTYVTDTRFWDKVGPVGYSITNQWRSESDVANSPGYKKRLNSIGRIFRDGDGRLVVWIRALIFCLLILPALVYLTVKLRRKKG